MSNAVTDQRDVSHGSTLLPRDLTEDELAGAPVLPSDDDATSVMADRSTP